MYRLLNKLHESSRQTHGWGLTELMITVLIIGILAAIAIPTFSGQDKETTAKKEMAEVDTIINRVGNYVQQTSAENREDYGVSSAPTAADPTSNDPSKSAESLLPEYNWSNSQVLADEDSYYASICEWAPTGAPTTVRRATCTQIVTCVEDYFDDGNRLCFASRIYPKGLSALGTTSLTILRTFFKCPEGVAANNTTASCVIYNNPPVAQRINKPWSSIPMPKANE